MKNSWSFNPFSYKGRIGRLNYIIGVILVTIISAIYEIIVFIFGMSFLFVFLNSSFANTVPPLIKTLLLPALLAGIVASVPLWLISSFHVKRLHDLGLPGKYFFGLMPGYKFIYARDIIYTRGTVGPNQYGEDPTPNSSSKTHWMVRHGVLVTLPVIAVVLFGAYVNIHQRIETNKKMQNINQTAYDTIIPNNITSSIFKEETTDAFGLKHLTIMLPQSSACYTIVYNPKTILADYKQTPDSSVLFNNLNNNFAFNVSPTYLGDVNTLATQIASRFDPIPTIQDFVTTSGIKGKEMAGFGWWQILIPTTKNQNGDIIVLSIDSNNLNYLKEGEALARSVRLNLNCE